MTDDLEALKVGVILGHADERRRERAERERERNALRHCRHRHPHPERVPHNDADHHAERDPLVIDDLVVDERTRDGEQHPHGCLLHAAAGLVRTREAAESEDEEDRRADIRDLDEQRSHLSASDIGHRRRDIDGIMRPGPSRGARP